jgi:hypothetical protein
MRAFTAPLCLTLWCSALAGCAGDGPARPPAELALAAGVEALSAGRAEGLEIADEQERYRVVARVNPARCEGPPFEVELRGAWVRVMLEAEEGGEVARRVEGWRAAQARLGGLGQRLLIEGRVTEQREDASGQRWPVFEVRAVVAELPMR